MYFNVYLRKVILRETKDGKIHVFYFYGKQSCCLKKYFNSIPKIDLNFKSL